MHRVRLLGIFGTSLVGLVLVLALFGRGCAKPVVQEKPTINLGEGNWTSNQVLTEMFYQIISKQLGYPVERIFGYGPIIWAAMDKGEVDIAPEIWFPARQGEIQPFLEKGTIELAGEIFGGAGNYRVGPRDVVEGDPARGIEPMGPDLQTILHLDNNWGL